MSLIQFNPLNQPGVEIDQEIIPTPPIIEDSSPLPALIIGILRKHINYTKAGIYTKTTTSTTYNFPDYEVASKIIASSVKIQARNIISEIKNSTTSTIVATTTGTVLSNSGNNNRIEHASANFTTLGVLINDTIVISLTGYGTVNAVVTNIVTTTNPSDTLEFSIKLPNSWVGQTVNFLVTRASGIVNLSNEAILTSNDINAFISPNVEPGDNVKIQHPIYGTIDSVVVEVIDSNEILLDKSIPNTTNISYEITRANNNKLEIISLSAGSMIPAPSETVTDILLNNNSSVNFADVKMGDIVTIIDNQSIVSATVVSVIDINRIQINKKLNKPSLSFIINRILVENASFVLTPSQINLGTIVNGFLETPIFQVLGSLVINTLTVKSCDIYVEYKYQSIKDASTPLEITTSNMESLVGKYDPLNNPLGTGVAIAKANTGLKVYAIVVESDTIEGWSKALAAAENIEAYSIAAMTQSPTIQSLVRTHVDAMSTANKHKWRICWINLPHPYEGITTPLRFGGLLNFVTSTINYLTLTDPLADLSDARVNGFVEIRYSGNIKYLRIIEKINNNTLKLEAKEYAPPTGVSPRKGIYVSGATLTAAPASDVQYEVFHVLDRATEAQTLANIANGISKRRVRYVTNETCILEYNGEKVEAPGYYICAAYAGIVSAVAPHQPLTFVPLSSILGVRKGSEYFKDIDHQGIIVRGGGWLVVQRVLDDGAPYAWKQTTTDTTSLKAAACSFTRNFDEITKAIYNALTPFPGRNNRVPEAIAAANDAVIAVLDARSIGNEPSVTGGSLGPRILNYTFSGHIEDPILPDTTYAEIELTLPLAWDYIKITMRA